MSSDLEPDITPSEDQGDTSLEQILSDSNADSDNFGLLAHMTNQTPISQTDIRSVLAAKKLPAKNPPQSKSICEENSCCGWSHLHCQRTQYGL